MAESTESAFKIGDRIVATAGNLNGQLGTVKWTGNISGQKGIWFGIEFDNPVGKHDGRYDGIRYFEAKSKHGAFLIDKNMILIENDFIQEQKEDSKTASQENPSVQQPQSEIDVSKTSEKLAENQIIENQLNEEIKQEKSEKVEKVEKVEKLPEKTQDKVPEKVLDKPITSKTEKKIAKEPIKKEEPIAVKKKVEVKPTKPTQSTSEKVEKTAKSDDSAEKDEKISELNEIIKKLNEELDDRAQHINDQASKHQELESNIQILNSKNKELIEKFSEKEKKYEEQIKNLENEDSEYKKKYRDTHTQLQESIKEKKELDIQMKMMQREAEKLRKDLEVAESSDTILEDAIIARDGALEKLEAVEKELKIAQEKILDLEEERELQQLEAEEALLNQAENSDIGKLQVDNLKLKQAIEKLYEQSEKEKKRLQEEIAKNASKLENVPQIEEKDKEIKSLKDEARKKDDIIEELKLRIDDAEESVVLAEKLSSDILDKEDEIIELRRKLNKLRSELETADQLALEGESFIKQLENEVIDREETIKKLEKKIKEFEDSSLEYDKAINKYKEKLNLIVEENKLLKDQNAEGREIILINKIDDLTKKQIEYLGQIRDRYKREITATLEKISNKNESLKSTILVSVLPKNLKDKMNIDGINKYCNVIALREKVFLLFSEIGKKYSTNIISTDAHEFYSWLKTLLFDLSELTYLLDLVEAKFIALSGQDNLVEVYSSFCKSSFFNQILAVNSIIDQLFNQLKEDNLSVKFHLDTLKLVLGKLNESCINFENDVALDLIKIKKFSYLATAEALELLYLVQSKGLKSLKLVDIFNNLLDLNLKLHFEQGDFGSLMQKGESDAKITILLKLQVLLSAASQSIQKSGDSKLSETETEIEKHFTKLGGLKVESDAKGLPNRGPWSFINSVIRNEIEQVSEISINNEKITQQLKEQQKENLLLLNEIKDLKTIKATLEKRASELQAKAERIPQLENDKKRLMDREKKFDEASKTIKEKLDEAEARNKYLEEEIQKVKANPQTIEVTQKDTKSSRQTVNRMSISRINTPSVLSDNLNQAVALNTDVEDYLEMIAKLILENSSLKSEWLKSKMNQLDTSMPIFSKCMEKYNLISNRENVFIGLTDDEQAKMSNSIQKIREIEEATKAKLCESSIISIKKEKKTGFFQFREIDRFQNLKKEQNMKS